MWTVRYEGWQDPAKFIAYMVEDIEDAKIKMVGWMKTTLASHLMRAYPGMTKHEAEELITKYAKETR